MTVYKLSPADMQGKTCGWAEFYFNLMESCRKFRNDFFYLYGRFAIRSELELEATEAFFLLDYAGYEHDATGIIHDHFSNSMIDIKDIKDPKIKKLNQFIRVTDLKLFNQEQDCLIENFINDHFKTKITEGGYFFLFAD